MIRLLTICLMLQFCQANAWAGQSCEKRLPDARTSELAANAGSALLKALEAEHLNSGQNLAIVSRIGQDLSKHGLLYSHAGFAMYQHNAWQVVHLLNECGTDNGQLYQEGLTEFFLDNALRFQSQVLWLNQPLREKVYAALAAHHGKAVFESSYSVIARPYSKHRQNSTAWLLEVIAAAAHVGPDSRAEAATELTLRGYQPDTIHISYGKRIAGGLFSANAVFTDHPISTRLSGNYPVTTVRSIVRFLGEENWIQSKKVLVPDGELELPGS